MYSIFSKYILIIPRNMSECLSLSESAKFGVMNSKKSAKFYLDTKKGFSVTGP